MLFLDTSLPPEAVWRLRICPKIAFTFKVESGGQFLPRAPAIGNEWVGKFKTALVQMRAARGMIMACQRMVGVWVSQRRKAVNSPSLCGHRASCLTFKSRHFLKGKRCATFSWAFFSLLDSKPDLLP